MLTARFLQDVVDVVRESGGIIRRQWEKTHAVRHKGSIDLVTETDVAVEMERNSPTHVAVENYFRRIWTNEDGEYTLPFEEYKDERVLIRPLWKFQEATGLCTW